MAAFLYKNLNISYFSVDSQNMEIISFDGEPERKSLKDFFKITKGSFSLPVKEKKYKRNDVVYNFAYPADKYDFYAGVVDSKVTFRTLLASLGSGLTRVFSYVHKDYKKILSIAAFFLLVAAGFTLTERIISYRVNHTGALVFNAEDSLDIEQLDLFMASFAMEENTIDENGIIHGEGVSEVSYSFTEPVTYQHYTVKSGDTIGGIAIKFGLKNISTRKEYLAK